MQRVIGIDFGTSTTYMSVKRYNGDQPAEDAFSYMPVMFNYGESSGYVVTIARENADGTFDFGEKAAEEMEGAKIYTEIKMYLESPDEDRRNEARRIVKEFFKFLYATYSQQAANLGGADDTEETVISYPVKWQQDTTDFMLEAATEAGFKNVRGMDEATAAVSTVLCHNAGKDLIRADRPGYLLLVDMGAGTTDLVVCKYQPDDQGKVKVELVNNWPRDINEPCFGGREVDRMLEGYVEAYLSKEPNPLMSANAHAFATRPGEAKKWKELNVSVTLAADKTVTTCGYLSSFKAFLSERFPAFGRKEFEEFARDGMKDYVKLLLGCLEDTAQKDRDFAATGVDLVILTGGHSAWYFAREIVDGTMDGYLDHPALAQVRKSKDHVVNLPNPQTTVSLGLVYSKLPFKLSKAAPVSEEKSKPHKPTGNDIEVLAIIQNAIASEPDLRQSNCVDREDLVNEMRKSFNLSADEQVLYAMDGFPLTVMTGKGIHQNRASNNFFMSWEQFGRSKLINHYAFGEGIQILFEAKNWQGVCNLHSALNQSRDTVTKKTASTKTTASKLDPRLLPIIKEFVQKNEILKGKISCMDRYQPEQLLKKLELGHLVGDEVYHASDEFTLSLLGRNKRIITSSGFGIRWHSIFGYSGDFVTWEEFMAADLTDTRSKVCIVMRNIDMSQDFVQLQQILLQEAAKLN